jgi:hypothetical protein
MIDILRERVYQKLRRNKELLIIKLTEESLEFSLWGEQDKIWQEKIVHTNMLNADILSIFLEEQVESCRKLLLHWEVADKVDCLVLLPIVVGYQEVFTLPILSLSEAKKAVRWDVQQQIEWDADSYSMAVKLLAQDGQNMQVEITALQHTSYNLVNSWCDDLQLNLQGIMLAVEQNEAQQSWYGGKDVNQLQPKTKWKLNMEPRKLKRGVLIFHGCCLLIGLAIYVSVYAGVYFAKERVEAADARLAQVIYLEKPYLQIKTQELTLKALNEKLLLLAEMQKSSGKVISTISKCIVSGCWLVSLRQAEQDNTHWYIDGRALDMQFVQQFMHRLDTTKKFAKVELMHSQQEKQEVSFRLDIKVKEDDYGKEK